MPFLRLHQQRRTVQRSVPDDVARGRRIVADIFIAERFTLLRIINDLYGYYRVIANKYIPKWLEFRITGYQAAGTRLWDTFQ